MDLAMIGDKIVPTEQLDPVYLDRAMFFGDGVYEVLRSYNGRLFALEQHLERFKRSLEAVAIGGISIDAVRRRVLTAFERARIADAKIYFHVTRGSAKRNHSWTKDIAPNFFLTVSAAPDSTAEKQTGIAVSTHPDWRWKRCDIKSLNLLANVLARQDAEDKGCQEAILVDDSGHITEGAGSCFFAVSGRKVCTAPLSANILPSITRQFVLTAAANLGLDVVEQSMTPAEAAGADELFLAVTTKDIVPVVKFDDAIIGNGTPGEITGLLIDEFRKFTVG